MDTQTAGLVGLALLVLVVIFAIVRYRQRAKFEIKGPGGIAATFEGENRQSQSASAPPASSGGINMERIKSGGSVHAEDHPGHGVAIKDVDAQGDVRAVSGSTPKADPPA